MAVSLSITGGGTVFLAGNPIQLVVTATASRSNHKLAVKVKCAGLLSPEQIEEIEPENLVAKFPINGLVDEPVEFTYQYPPVGGANPYDVLARNIELEIGEVWDDANGDRQEAWTAVPSSIRVIEGLLSDHELQFLNQQNKSFYSEYIQGGKFLTHLPVTLIVSPRQKPVLWYLSKFTENHPAIKNLRITTNQRVYDYAAEVTFWSITGLVEFPIHYQYTDFTLAEGEIILSYEFWISDTSGNISEHRYFIVDNNHHEQNIFLHYKNRFSVIENIWAHGEIKQLQKTDLTTSIVPVPVGAGTMTGSVRTVSRTGNRMFTINMGYKSKAERLALRGFIESTERWIADPENSDVLIPVYLEGGEFLLDDTFEDLVEVEFTLHESHLK